MKTLEAHNKIQYKTGFTDSEYQILKLNENWQKQYRTVLNYYRFHDDNEEEILNGINQLNTILDTLRVSSLHVV